MTSYEWKFNDEANFGVSDQVDNIVVTNLNTNEKISSSKYDIDGGYTINNYDDIVFINLNSLHNPDASFTIEFTMKELLIDTTKPVNYMTFGYHIRNKSGVTVTIGRPVNSKNVVIGTITQSGTEKAYPIGDLETIENTEYIYTLMYNNYTNDHNKFKLFRGFDLISTSQGLLEKNFSIVDRKLFFGTSCWTNEIEWESAFDLAKIQIKHVSFVTNVTIDKTFIKHSEDYPLHHEFVNTTNETRNVLNVCGINDIVNISFHCSRSVAPGNVHMLIDNSNVYQKSVDSYIVDDSFTTLLYTYQLQVRPEWPSNGILAYYLDFNGNNVNDLTIDKNIYIDTTQPSFTYGIESSGDNFITLIVNEITDSYLDFNNNLSQYSITFYASNDTHIQNNRYINPIIGNNYTITNLLSETVYTIYASITDAAKNNTSNILPINTNVIETLDVTFPVLGLGKTNNSIVSIFDDNKKAGIQTVINTYDTAANDIRKFEYFVAIYDEAFATIDYDDIYINCIIHLDKYDNVPNLTTSDIYQYYNKLSSSKEDMYTEKLYHIYFVSKDSATPPNKTYIYQTHYINNEITFMNAISQTIDGYNDVAQNDDDIVINWTSSLYTVPSDYTVLIMNDTIIPTTNDGLSWEARNTVNQDHSTGIVQYSVNQVRDLQPFSNFDNIGNDVIHIQNIPPVITSCVLSATVTTMFVNNMHLNIIDETITDNNNKFSISVNAINAENLIIQSSFTNEYANLSELQNDTNENLKLDGLVENTNYNIYASLSNIFNENTDMLIGNKFTSSDDPEITILCEAKNIDGYPYIHINHNSTVYDANTNFYFYLEVSDVLLDETGIVDFFRNTSGINKKAENISSGSQRYIVDYINSNINTFWKYDSIYTDTDTLSYIVTGSYQFSGDADGQFPNLTVKKGDTLNFDLDVPGHPFWIKTILGSGSTNAVINIANNGSIQGLISWTPYVVGTYYYQCGIHSSMNGQIIVEDNASLVYEYNETTLLPSSQTKYYVYGLINDEASDVTSINEINFDYSMSIPTLSNIDNSIFIRNDDTIYLKWTTPYVSSISDFDISIMNININDNISSFDNLTWETFHIMNYDTNDYSQFDGDIAIMDFDYLTSQNINSYNGDYFIDLYPPNYNLQIYTIGTTTITTRFLSFDDKYKGVENYTLNVTASNVIYGESNITFQNTFDNLSTQSFTIENLYEGEKYKLYSTITDPAGNSLTKQYNSGNLVKTFDTTNPILLLESSSFNHNEGETYITCSNVNSYDKHSTFSTYIGLFDTNETVTYSDLLFFKNTSACLYFEENPKSLENVEIFGSFSQVITFNSSTFAWNLTPSLIDFNKIYYVFGTSIDGDGNFIDSQIVSTQITVNSGPILNIIDYVVEIPDETGISAGAAIRISYEEVVTEDGSLSYIGKDKSGNNNHVTINTDTNPLSEDSIVSTRSLDLGKVNEVILSPSLELKSTFTYSTWFKKTEEVGEIILLKNNDNPLVVLQGNVLSIKSGIERTFAIDIEVDKWTQFTVSSDATQTKVYVNGELLESIDIIGDTYVQPIGRLTIPKQENILIDDTRIYETILDSRSVQKLVSVSGKEIHLSFESEGYIFDYNVTMSNNNFYFNNIKSPYLTINKGGIYTFYQDVKDNSTPLLFSENGTYESLFRNLNEIEYFIDDTSIGNDPLQYAMHFDKSTTNINKVMIYPNTLTKLYYNSVESHIISNTIIVSQQEPDMINYGNQTLKPIYNIRPMYVEDTPIGNFALKLNKDDQTSITFNTVDIDANNMSILMWVKLDDFKNNPIVTQDGIFEFGLNSNGNTYFNLLNNENVTEYITSLESVTFDKNKIILSNVEINPTNPTYVYYFASTTKRTKYEAMDIIDKYRGSNIILEDELTTTNVTTLTKNITYIIDKTDNIYSTSCVDNAYVYVSARDNNQTDFTLSVKNHFEEYVIDGDINNPIIHLDNVLFPSENSNYIRIESAKLYNQIPVDKYYFCAFEVSSNINEYQYDVNVFDNQYIISGDVNGPYADINNVFVGDVLRFNVNTPNHPFWIKTTSQEIGSSYAVNVSSNGIEEGIIEWIPYDHGTYYYQCGYHANMNGQIIVQERIIEESFEESLVQDNIEQFINNLPIDLQPGLNSIYGGSNNIYMSEDNPNENQTVLNISDIQLDSVFTSLIDVTNNFADIHFDNIFKSVFISKSKGVIHSFITEKAPPILTLNDQNMSSQDILSKLIVSYSGRMFYGWGGLAGVFSDSINTMGGLVAGEGNAPTTIVIDLSWGTGKYYFVKQIGINRSHQGRYNTMLTISDEDGDNQVVHTLQQPEAGQNLELFDVNKMYNKMKIYVHGNNIGRYHYISKIAVFT